MMEACLVMPSIGTPSIKCDQYKFDDSIDNFDVLITLINFDIFDEF